MSNELPSELSITQRSRLGKEALIAFQNQMVAVWGNTYNVSIQELQNLVLSREPEFLLNLGESVYMAKIGQRRLDEAMERVALAGSPTEIPKLFTFQQGIAQELSDFDFSLFGDTALDIAKDAIKGGQNIVEKSLESSQSVIEGIGSTADFFGKHSTLIIGVVLAVLAFIGVKWAERS